MYSAANFLESMAKGNKQNKDCFLHEWFSLALGCPIPYSVKGEAKISAHRRYCLRHILGDANCFLGYTLCFWLKPVKLGKPFIVRRHCVHEGWISGKIEDTWSLEAYLFEASTNAIGALPIQPNTCVLAADCATRHTQVIACCIVPQAHWVANTFSSCEVPTLRISSVESWGFWVSLPETSQVPVLLAGNGKYEWASVCLLLLACFLEVASANKFQNTRVWDEHGVQQLKSQISQAKDTGSKTFYPQSNKWQYQNIRMHLAGHHVFIIPTQSVILFQKYP